ncbi:sensor histidine kinase [Paenibacillus sp. YIM B09110]|uniref:sensor histidine kinase n=1 Tax=Paenibacillus sp. YIM B09110 TaxID=3126102 RepID=UPI00301CEE70
MKSSFTRIILISYGLYAMAYGLFLYALLELDAGRKLIFLSSMFAIVGAVILVFFMLAIRRQMGDVLTKLSLTIQSIIDREDRELFSTVEDNLLSKLQVQVIKLSRILKMQSLKAKEENEEMKTLISDIAHQLKTPLANLNMYVSLLGDRHLPPQKRESFIVILANQTDKLSWLMESLIKMSRLESGIVAIRQETSSINSTVLSAIKQIYPVAERQGIVIEFESQQETKVSHDSKWTAEAIFNVLDNAVKYGRDSGTIKVSVQPYEMFVRIDIEDQGSGIEESEISDIFKRFYRGREASETQGVGIGLYLARKIITDQSGYMKVTSDIGKGSIFSIYLPI